jgi:hypothetical protein
MIYENWEYKPKWFNSDSPKNPKKAKATLTFDGVVADAETVAIGLEIYEFKTSGSAGAGKIKVDISGAGNTAPDKAAAKLAQTINANSTIVIATAGEDADEKDIVTIEYKEIGTEGNAVTIGANCEHASFGDGVLTLQGGQYGTPCPMKNILVFIDLYYYLCTQEGGTKTVEWKRFTPINY